MTNTPGAALHEPAWVTLSTADPQAAATFYQAVLGWEISEADEQLHALVGGRPVAAIVQTTSDASGWLLHFEVDHIATAVDIVIRAGGSTLVPPTANSGEAIAVMTDSSERLSGCTNPGPNGTAAAPAPEPSPGGN